MRNEKGFALDFDLKNPHSVDPNSFIVASWEVARIEQANRLQKKRMVAISLDPASQEGCYTLDPALVAAIKQLPSHLQLVVMLMTNMVTQDEEDRLREKQDRMCSPRPLA